MSKKEVAQKALYLCRDRSDLKQEGKWINRPKALRPPNQEALRRVDRCRKKAFSNIELAKRAIRSANIAREKAEKIAGDSRRCEIRYYVCENCGIGSGRTGQCVNMIQTGCLHNIVGCRESRRDTRLVIYFKTNAMGSQ